MGPGVIRASIIQLFSVNVGIMDYVNVYIDRKFKELKLNSITFVAKMCSK